MAWFSRETDTPMSANNLSRRHFKPLLKRAGLPDVRLYDLRHTFATLWLESGGTPKDFAGDPWPFTNLRYSRYLQSRRAPHAARGDGTLRRAVYDLILRSSCGSNCGKSQIQERAA